LKSGIPLVVFKVGKTEAGIKAIASHTAALAGSDNIFDAFFRQKGIVRAMDSDALIDYAKIFANSRRAKGRGAGILSTSGGAGIMSVDTFLEYGMEIPDLTEESTQAIAKIIPSYGSALNPVDVTAQIFGEPAYMQQCLQVLVDDPHVDFLLVSLSTVGGETAEKIAEGIISVYNNTEKPIAVSWGASERLVGTAFARLGEAGVPLYKQPIRCSRALAVLANYSMLEEEFANNQAFTEVLPSGGRNSPMAGSAGDVSRGEPHRRPIQKLLGQAGIPVTRETLVDEEEEAAVPLLLR
jgi:acetate---CoA ligase (ADP-forming)